MTKHQYQPKNFLMHTPNALVGRYFHERGLLASVDMASLDETNVEPIYEAWMELPPETRAKVEEDFRLVDTVADEPGIVAILEEARYHGEELGDVFADMDSLHSKAMWTFLERWRCLDVAARFRDADELPRNYWKDRNGIPMVPPRDDGAACEGLASLIMRYFRQKEGRGHACSVEVFRRGAKYYYFAYPEDHARSGLEYQGNENRLTRRVHRPVFDVVFVYDPENGTLSTYYQGDRTVVRELQELFAREILVINLPGQMKDDQVYELNPLKYRDFQFRHDPASGITDVRVKQLKFAVIGRGTRRITLDEDLSRGTMYDLLDGLLDTGTAGSPRDSIPLAMLNVVRVGIQARFVPGVRRRRPQKTFHIGYPNSCSLGHEGRDAALRKMLIDSGLQPRPPSLPQPPLLEEN